MKLFEADDCHLSVQLRLQNTHSNTHTLTVLGELSILGNLDIDGDQLVGRISSHGPRHQRLSHNCRIRSRPNAGSIIFDRSISLFVCSFFLRRAAAVSDLTPRAG